MEWIVGLSRVLGFLHFMSLPSLHEARQMGWKWGWGTQSSSPGTRACGFVWTNTGSRQLPTAEDQDLFEKQISISLKSNSGYFYQNRSLLLLGNISFQIGFGDWEPTSWLSAVVFQFSKHISCFKTVISGLWSSLLNMIQTLHTVSFRRTTKTRVLSPKIAREHQPFSKSWTCHQLWIISRCSEHSKWLGDSFCPIHSPSSSGGDSVNLFSPLAASIRSELVFPKGFA